MVQNAHLYRNGREWHEGPTKASSEGEYAAASDTAAAASRPNVFDELDQSEDDLWNARFARSLLSALLSSTQSAGVAPLALSSVNECVDEMESYQRSKQPNPYRHGRSLHLLTA
jgi:hypothetical protein